MWTSWQIELTDAERAALRPVGYWRSPKQPDLPDPAVYVDAAWDDTERQAALVYLRESPSCQRWCGYATCRICGESGPELGDADVTDGVWIWPAGLPHYLQHHAVRPPEPFLAHLGAARFASSATILPPETTLARLDPRIVRPLRRSEDGERIRLRLERPASAGELYLGVEIDRRRGCFRLELNDALLAAERRRNERRLHPPAWRRAIRLFFGL